MVGDPLVSVVMPSYNAEPYIAEAINSILCQSYQNFELLVCDDCSTDKSLEIARSFGDPRIEIFTNEENLGYLITCNSLFEKCKGDYITFQDADDHSSTDRLEIMLEHFASYPDISLFGSYSRYFSGNSGKTIKVRNHLPHEQIEDIVKRYNPFNGATICIRKEVYRVIGGYNLFFDRIGSEDYDWLSRIVEKFVVGVIPEVLYHVRLTDDSVSRSIKSPMQLISHDIVRFCQEQRALAGSDGISGGNREELDRFVANKLEPYLKDQSLVFRKAAEVSMYNKHYKKALANALLAIREVPSRLINYRLLIYVLRKSNLNLIK